LFLAALTRPRLRSIAPERALPRMTTAALGNFLNILLVFAIVFFLIHIILARSIGNA